ncbi:MAG: hypothetical protein EOM05_05655 [Clostridia bacterium]|nr:hypothetical protein [Clostridia bacterium]
MSISFNGYNDNSATFEITGTVATGEVVKMSANNKVTSCTAGNDFCGVLSYIESDDFATVQLSGYAEVEYTETAPTVGYCTLAGNGTGGVKVASTGGRSHLVLNVDTTSKIVGFLL